MTVEEYEKKIKEIVSEMDLSDIHTSPDFQCDQTGGFPTSLCACFEKGLAWLTLNVHLAPDGVDIAAYEQMCADYGIRLCCDAEQYNELLKNLGEDAYNTAYLPDEDENMVMGGI